APPLEEHDRDVDARSFRRRDPLPRAVKIGGVELAQVEARLAVAREGWPHALPRLRRAVLDRLLLSVHRGSSQRQSRIRLWWCAWRNARYAGKSNSFGGSAVPIS